MKPKNTAACHHSGGDIPGHYGGISDPAAPAAEDADELTRANGAANLTPSPWSASLGRREMH